MSVQIDFSQLLAVLGALLFLYLGIAILFFCFDLDTLESDLEDLWKDIKKLFNL